MIKAITDSKCLLDLHRYNVRDVFEVYAGEKDPDRVDELVSRAKVDLRTMQMLSKWNEKEWAFGLEASSHRHPRDCVEPEQKEQVSMTS